MQQNPLLSRLRSQLQTLKQEVLDHDKLLPTKDQKMIQNIARFNDELFVQHGAKLLPCIEQLEKNINNLEKQLNSHISFASIQYSCERIQDRFTAVKRAIITTKINIKSAQQQKASKRAYWTKRNKKQHSNSGFEWIAASVMQNSHQIYGELTKHLQWAAKIEQKIAQMELHLENATPSNKIKLQNDILAMHRRLGKCKQAITYIEERIQFFERPKQGFK